MRDRLWRVSWKLPNGFVYHAELKAPDVERAVHVWKKTNKDVGVRRLTQIAEVGF